MGKKNKQPTYNGVPKQVVIEAFAAKRRLNDLMDDITTLDIGSAANMLTLPALEQWCWENPQGIAQLKQAMNEFVSGLSPDDERNDEPDI